MVKESFGRHLPVFPSTDTKKETKHVGLFLLPDFLQVLVSCHICDEKNAWLVVMVWKELRVLCDGSLNHCNLKVTKLKRNFGYLKKRQNISVFYYVVRQLTPIWSL